MEAVIELRRELHRSPELSGFEEQTAARMVRFFEPLRPDQLLRGLGGHGVAFVFESGTVGPSVLLRCELDAVPVVETLEEDHRSTQPGVAHACGHDGHMAILASVGIELSKMRPERGRVVLLFQPAEETGKGARSVLEDSRFDRLRPNFAFALHNLPGFPMGEVILRTGTLNCASRGMSIELRGTSAHAAQPQTGKAPTRGMCRIIEALENLSSTQDASSESTFATVVGAHLGEKAFGTAPGLAQVWATLRCETDDAMEYLAKHVETKVAGIANAEGLGFSMSREDEFAATINSENAIAIAREAARGLPVRMLDRPFPWSEDFGRFTSLCEGALIGLGAGVHAPALHDPGYDFPEELLTVGSSLLLKMARRVTSDGVRPKES